MASVDGRFGAILPSPGERTAANTGLQEIREQFCGQDQSAAVGDVGVGCRDPIFWYDHRYSSLADETIMG